MGGGAVGVAPLFKEAIPWEAGCFLWKGGRRLLKCQGDPGEWPSGTGYCRVLLSCCGFSVWLSPHSPPSRPDLGQASLFHGEVTVELVSEPRSVHQAGERDSPCQLKDGSKATVQITFSQASLLYWVSGKAPPLVIWGRGDVPRSV